MLGKFNTSLFDEKQLIAHIQNGKINSLDLSNLLFKDEKVEPKNTSTLSGHENHVSALTVLPDGRLASGYPDKTIQLWDANSGNCLATLHGHESRVLALTVLPDGRLASGSQDKTIKLWDANSGKCLVTLRGHESVVSTLTVLPDGRLASGSQDKTIKLWDVKSGNCLTTLRGHELTVLALTVLPDGRLASGSQDKTIKLWDVKSGICLATLSGHDSYVWALTVLPDGRLASGSWDQTIKLWDGKSGNCLATLNGHSDNVLALTLLPDGRLISGSSDNTIKFWNVNNGNCLATLSGHVDWVNALTVLSDGRLASGSADKTIKFWDVGLRLLALPQLKAVLTALQKNKSIRSLNLQNTVLDDNAIPELITLLQPNTALTELDIRHTAITAQGTKLLAQGLKQRAVSLEVYFSDDSVITIEAANLPAPIIKPELKPLPPAITEFSDKKDEKPVVAAPILTSVPRIAWKELTVGDLIGNGSYGDVYKGQWYGKAVAIKQLQLKTLSDPSTKEFIRESQIMWDCDSSYIVGLRGVCTEPGHFAMVMEYMPRGSLRQRLQDDKELPWPQRWQLAIDIAEGIKYLHGRGILHRDLKSFNILLDANERAKIADFGLAKVKLEINTSTTKSNKAVGSVRWRAPELFDPDTQEDTKAADIYSLGMILWEIATKQLPYANAKDEQTVINWITRNIKVKIPEDCPKALADIIQACWVAPDQRPSAEEIVTRLKQAQAQLNSKESKAEKEKPWHFDVATRPPAHEVKDYALIPASPKDIQKVCDFYLHGSVAGYDIKSVQVIYNPNLNEAFARTLPLIQGRHGQSAFAPKWSTENNSEWRGKVNARLEQIAAPYQDSDFPNVKLLPVWHGTRSDILPSLFKTGFAALAVIDTGYFGRGLYSSYEAEYAYQVYSKGALLVNWVAFYSAYPVIDGDMKKLKGGPAYQNYDAHFAPVAPQFPDPNCESFIPCQPNQQPKYMEVVVFERAQCLPRYLVELQPSFPKAPSANTPVTNFFAQQDKKDKAEAPAKKQNAQNAVSDFKLGM